MVTRTMHYAAKSVRKHSGRLLYRAIAQLVEQEKRSFDKSSCSNFLIGLLIPLSPVRVRLALLYVYKNFNCWAIADPKFFGSNSNGPVSDNRIAYMYGAVAQMDRAV